MAFEVLVINPGSTSTKVAWFRDEEEVFSETQRYDSAELARFGSVVEQREFRLRALLAMVEGRGLSLSSLSAVVGRGGLLHPLEGGTYLVNEAMVEDLMSCRYGEHASNLGAVMALDVVRASGRDIPAFIVDPVVVDELWDVARPSGMPLIERRSIFHALNQKASARWAAARLGRAYEEVNLVVAHMGGGISVGAHLRGRVVEVNNALDGEGPFAPERAGSLPAGELVNLCFSGRYTLEEMRRKLVGGGGMVAHLGTSDLRKVKAMIESGDERARLVFEAMAYQVARWIGACAAALSGQVDAVVLTGGLAHDADFVDRVRRRVSFIAPVMVHPGEFEMEALRDGALRILRGQERPRVYERW